MSCKRFTQQLAAPNLTSTDAPYMLATKGKPSQRSTRSMPPTEMHWNLPSTPRPSVTYVSGRTSRTGSLAPMLPGSCEVASPTYRPLRLRWTFPSLSHSLWKHQPSLRWPCVSQTDISLFMFPITSPLH